MVSSATSLSESSAHSSAAGSSPHSASRLRGAGCRARSSLPSLARLCCCSCSGSYAGQDGQCNWLPTYRTDGNGNAEERARRVRLALSYALASKRCVGSLTPYEPVARIRTHVIANDVETMDRADHLV